MVAILCEKKARRIRGDQLRGSNEHHWTAASLVVFVGTFWRKTSLDGGRSAEEAAI